MKTVQTRAFLERPYYLHNFVQATFDCLGAKKLKGSTLLVSGDGRYYNAEALQIVLKIASANKVKKVIVGRGGLLSTPAISNLIRTRKEKHMLGGFILTASHDPGGKDHYFGIKFNTSDGAPASESFTNALCIRTRSITAFKFAKNLPDIDIDTLGMVQLPGPFGTFTVEVVDPAEEYTARMKDMFDFAALQKFVARKDFSMVFDGMNGVAGPYAQRIFVEELGAHSSSLIRCDPKQDFGNKRPDPKLIHTSLLAGMMGLKTSSFQNTRNKNYPALGAATDGDAGKNFILGRQLSITPSDSLAIIAANAKDAIPHFSKGLVGVARSMPTSRAVDVVARSLGVPHFEVPTGRNYFSKLMDSNKCNLVGGESFETGSDHVREMDGIWAVLAWLSILAHRNRVVPPGLLIGVEDIAKEHWRRYGRHYTLRYDYDEVESIVAHGLLKRLVVLQRDLQALNSCEELVARGMEVLHAREFSYTDPVDGSVCTQGGVIFDLADESRFVYRLSDAGMAGYTVHVHVERHVRVPGEFNLHPSEALHAHVDAALSLVRLDRRFAPHEPSLVS